MQLVNLHENYVPGYYQLYYTWSTGELNNIKLARNTLKEKTKEG